LKIKIKNKKLRDKILILKKIGESMVPWGLAPTPQATMWLRHSMHASTEEQLFKKTRLFQNTHKIFKIIVMFMSCHNIF